MRLFLLGCFLAAAVHAHDLDLSVEYAQPAVVVHALYGGAEPVTDADVSIFSPENPDSPYQTGITDIAGLFAFVPSGAGQWRVVIDDGFGHRAEQEIAVDWSAASSDAAPSGARSTADKAVLGVSIIFGLTGLLLWSQSRRGGRPA